MLLTAYIYDGMTIALLLLQLTPQSSSTRHKWQHLKWVSLEGVDYLPLHPTDVRMHDVNGQTADLSLSIAMPDWTSLSCPVLSSLVQSRLSSPLRSLLMSLY